MHTKDTRKLAFDAGGLEIRVVNVAVNEHHIDDVVANVTLALHLVHTPGLWCAGG